MTYRLGSLATLGVALLLAGCEKGDGIPRGTAKGRVTIAGKPASEVTVAFENKAAGVAQTAPTDADGKYEFITYETVGLPAASYKVTVSSGRFMQPGEEIPRFDIGPGGKTAPPPKPPTSVPAKYAKVDTSGLSADVKAGDNPPFDFDLKP